MNTRCFLGWRQNLSLVVFCCVMALVGCDGKKNAVGGDSPSFTVGESTIYYTLPEGYRDVSAADQPELYETMHSTMKIIGASLAVFLEWGNDEDNFLLVAYPTVMAEQNVSRSEYNTLVDKMMDMSRHFVDDSVQLAESIIRDTPGGEDISLQAGMPVLMKKEANVATFMMALQVMNDQQQVLWSLVYCGDKILFVYHFGGEIDENNAKQAVEEYHNTLNAFHLRVSP